MLREPTACDRGAGRRHATAAQRRHQACQRRPGRRAWRRRGRQLRIGSQSTTLLTVARAAALALLGVLASCSRGRTPRVLLIGIDGVRVDVLRAVPTPHIDSLAGAGLFSDRAQTTLPTRSGPGWSSMLTGVWPAKHGVTSNQFAGNHYQRYPDFLTRIEQERPQLETFAAADWLPLVTYDAGGPLIGNLPDRKFIRDGYQNGLAGGGLGNGGGSRAGAARARS